MKKIDVSQLVVEIKRVRRVPLLGPMIRRLHLASKTSAFVLLVFSCVLVYFLCLLASYAQPPLSYVILLLAGLVGLVLLLATRGIVKLDRISAANSIGAYGDWINGWFGPGVRIPRKLPEDFPGKLKAGSALLLSLLFGLVAVGSLPVLVYQLPLRFVEVIAALSGGSDAETIASAFGEFFGAAMFLIAPFLLNRTWRYWLRLTAVPSAEVLKNESRKPVLFLRSFRDDTVAFRRGAHEQGAANPLPGFLAPKSFFEERLAEFLWREGPVVAIGKPGESLPRFGACREYHSDDTWQGRVLELIEKSGLIVMMIGLTEALGWEIHQLRDHGALSKCLFVMPPLPDQEIVPRFEKFAAQMAEFSEIAVLDSREMRNFVGVIFDAKDGPVCFSSRQKTPLDYDVAIYSALRYRSRSGAV